MNVRISILDGPLPARQTPPRCENAGALLVFEGIVRRREDGREIEALDYQTYEPMAQQMLESLARRVLERHGLIAVEVEHSRGRVPVAACSFRLVIAAGHRGPALAAMDEFIDLLKRDVPIWKRPVWQEAGGSAADGGHGPLGTQEV